MILSSEDVRCDDAVCILCSESVPDELSLDLSDLWHCVAAALPDRPASPHVELSPDPSGEYDNILRPVLEMSVPGTLNSWEALAKAALEDGIRHEIWGECIPFPKMWYIELSLEELAPVVQKDLEVYHVALVRLRSAHLFAPRGRLLLGDERAFKDSDDDLDYRTRFNVPAPGHTVRKDLMGRTRAVSDSLRIVPRAYRYGFCQHTVLYEDRSRDVMFAERMLRPLREEIGGRDDACAYFESLCPGLTNSNWWLGFHHPTFVDQSRCIRYSTHTAEELRQLALDFCDRYDTGRGCLECHYAGARYVCEVCRRRVSTVAWSGGEKGVMACVGANGCFSQVRYKNV